MGNIWLIMARLQKLKNDQSQIVFLLCCVLSGCHAAPPEYQNETRTIVLPDNETIINMNIAARNKSPVMNTVSNIIQSPAVVDQMVSAVSKALEVEDSKELAAIQQSIRTAFNKIGSNKQKKDKLNDKEETTEKNKENMKTEKEKKFADSLEEKTSDDLSEELEVS